MKITLLKKFLVGFMLLPFVASGQTTVTNSIFPVPGDTLRTVITFNLPEFDKEMVGEDLYWDLSNASGGFLSETFYAEPTMGSASEMFPDADLLDNTTLQEIYYQTTEDNVIEIGRSGLDPVLNLIDLTYQNDGEAVFRTAPISYEDTFADSSSFFIAAPGDVLPDSLLALIPAQIDSLRLLVETKNESEVDAWGTVELPGGDTYDVLRVKRTTTTNAVLGAKVPIFGWINVDPDVPLFAVLGDLLDLLGENVTVSYQFLADGEKEVIALFSEGPEGDLISFSYKGDMTTSINKIDRKKEDILTYPNPTFGDVTFQLINMPHDNYKVVLYNIIGKQLWSSDINFIQGKLRANLSHLQKGTYFYSIVNGAGQKVTTRRLMIMTP